MINHRENPKWRIEASLADKRYKERRNPAIKPEKEKEMGLWTEIAPDIESFLFFFLAGHIILENPFVSLLLSHFFFFFLRLLTLFSQHRFFLFHLFVC